MVNMGPKKRTAFHACRFFFLARSLAPLCKAAKIEKRKEKKEGICNSASV
jgi:hypothetical protein